MKEVERLQDNLLLVRRTVGWTAEEFGEKIGVTRQTINNLESKRNKLTKTQYIAIRSILDAEICQHSDDTDMLRLILDVFIDHPEKYDAKVRKELLTKANMLTPAILAGTTSRKEVSEEFTAGAEMMGIITKAMLGALGPIVINGIAEWLYDIISERKKK